MAVQGFYPEMSQARPETTVEASLSHYGRHWFVTSKDKLPEGRGVVFLETYTAAVLVPGSRLVGWHHYKLTCRAFDALCKRSDVAVEMLL